MGLVTIVRHGQASTFAKEYDRLSELGHTQSRLLGEYWADRGIAWDRVLVGPRLRHEQTEAGVAAVYRARGLPWPAAERVNELDELEFTKVVAHVARKSPSGANAITKLHLVPEQERAQAMKAVFRYTFGVTREYAAGALAVPEAESWAEFVGRVQRALNNMVSSGRGQRVLVFSSGGFTGMLVGCVLGLDKSKAIDLMMQVRNGSYTSVMYSPTQQSLTSFNSVPHLPPQMWTVG
jgi:broad specificity phosphatase PhoE